MSRLVSVEPGSAKRAAPRPLPCQDRKRLEGQMEKLGQQMKEAGERGGALLTKPQRPGDGDWLSGPGPGRPRRGVAGSQ